MQNRVIKRHRVVPSARRPQSTGSGAAHLSTRTSPHGATLLHPVIQRASSRALRRLFLPLKRRPPLSDGLAGRLASDETARGAAVLEDLAPAQPCLAHPSAELVALPWRAAVLPAHVSGLEGP